MGEFLVIMLLDWEKNQYLFLNKLSLVI